MVSTSQLRAAVPYDWDNQPHECPSAQDVCIVLVQGGFQKQLAKANEREVCL